jgi:crotonobetainyl-CoA:carnitine CoA-transferase CaiB-like acyl-CoA transferase
MTVDKDNGGLPLEGLVVIDASTIIAGPLAAGLLGEYGATVIKVEHPTLGDGARRIGYSNTGAGAWWKALAQNKRCVTCDLRQPDGAALFRRLVARADVLVENFRPGTLERWGLGPENLRQVNERLVLLRISGFGQTGPYSSRPGYGTLAEAMSGFAEMTGQPDGPPTLPAVPVADGITGIMGAASCLVALWNRDRPDGTGKGDVIDLSLYGSLTYAFGMFVTEHLVSGVLPTRRGNRLGNAPRNAWPCADGGWVAYSAQSASMIKAIVEFVGKSDDPRFSDPMAAVRYGDEIDALLGAWIRERPREEVLRELIAAGVPVGPIYDVSELYNDQHVRFRSDFVEVEDPDFGQVTLPVGPARFASGQRHRRQPGPALGAHNGEVYGDWLGLSPSEIDELRARGVI